MELKKDFQVAVKQELKEFEVFYKDVLKTNNNILNIVLKYIIKHKGKQMRPLLVLLSAKMNGQINTDTYVAATMIELLHTATLVHDDVVDNSQIRRNAFSIKALWKSKIAVLVGDYLLSKGLLLSVDHSAFDLLKIVSVAVKDMSEGELLQIKNAKKINLNIDEYYRVISKKTASLIIAATESGASSVTDDLNKLEITRLIGKNIGIAFQIKDDLFDFEETSQIGKPKGNDIQESKMTLPIIYALKNADKKEKQRIIKKLKSSKKSKNTIKEIQNFVKINGGIHFAIQEMEYYVNNAKKMIITNYEPNKLRDAYISLIDYVVSRKR